LTITAETLRQLGEIVYLDLTGEEMEEILPKLREIIGQGDLLPQLDGIEPTRHITPLESVLRKDQVGLSLSKEAVLMNGPEIEDGFFLVPRILED
jgi:aspartyl-tRNA(Asn)/glutamyl-tRNA(Gln) amidotransferase subunit C